MIVYFRWYKHKYTKAYRYDGWFLFGVLPIYYRSVEEAP